MSVIVQERTPNVVQLDNPKVKVIQLTQRGLQGTPGVDGAGGLMEVEDDLSPSLGGDLTLGAFNIIGQLENTTLTLDGGLL